MARARAEAQAILNAARETAEHLREEQLNQARVETARLIEQARRAIASEREQAKQQLRAYVIDLTIEATRRIIGKSLDVSTQHELIVSTIDEVVNPQISLGKQINA
jgi:F-type H+-transporting ATPase subunit b